MAGELPYKTHFTVCSSRYEALENWRVPKRLKSIARRAANCYASFVLSKPPVCSPHLIKRTLNQFFYADNLVLSYKLGCYTRISSPERSLNDTREKK